MEGKEECGPTGDTMDAMEKTCCSSGVLGLEGPAELGSLMSCPHLLPPASPLSWDPFHSPRATVVPAYPSHPSQHGSRLCLSCLSSGPQTRIPWLYLNQESQDFSSSSDLPLWNSTQSPERTYGVSRAWTGWSEGSQIWGLRSPMKVGSP
jgi:hypothetical protein